MLVMSSSGSAIVLDPSIRDWVLIPITLVMFLQGVLRQYVAGALREQGPKVDTDMAAKNQLLRRSQRLRANGHYLLPQAFQMRKRFFVDRAFKEKPKVEGEEPAVPAQDPFVMMNMMKQNMAMIVPNMLLMGWVSYFFPGFVMAKLPFGLTDRFKQMLQRGIFLSSLNVSYITSLSWYVINLFGMRGLFSLVLGSGNAALDDPNAMASQMQMQAGMGQQPDINKLYNQEKTELEIVQHDFAIRHSEERLLARIQSNKKRLH